MRWTRFWACVCRAWRALLVLLLVWGECGQCCGPGRGGGRRRAARQLMPLVFKQHVPNVEETTLGASGLTEGRIARNDPRFQDLVPNYNADIRFSDEEGTGADRLMTERCREHLNTLSIIVMNHWPGLRLVVIEAWDEDTWHKPNSLHYEGRAVDVTTSDNDPAKHGMLARFAVRAGFDWVYYESRYRIHCSVKSETTARRRLGGCFPGDAHVDTPSGAVPLASLTEGALVRVLRPDGSTAFSPVLMFLHRDENAHRPFLTLVMEKGLRLTLTPSHLIFIMRRETAPVNPTAEDVIRHGQATMAGSVIVGSYVIVSAPNSSQVIVDRILTIETRWASGIFAPLTAEGSVMVNGVVASCYAVIDSQRTAHLAFLPVRTYFAIKNAALSTLQYLGLIQLDKINSTQTSLKRFDKMNNNSNIILNNSDKWNFDSKSQLSDFQHIHWYPRLLYRLAAWILPSDMVYS